MHDRGWANGNEHTRSTDSDQYTAAWANQYTDKHTSSTHSYQYAGSTDSNQHTGSGRQ